ncbi:MAG TPA: TMEM175 family protein, partial [Thermoanaerobaculia bacterium]|nr:TMEM175 family protein [Thermoanaerobaculia bacterium]
MNELPFRLRGREVSRLEAFSDIVFGFALTLIVVSLEVPTRYEELMAMMRGFPAFAICFAMLTWIWYVHHTFFRRYALSDEITIAINTALLFLVLFYTYPLKFMFSVVTGQIR